MTTHKTHTWKARIAGGLLGVTCFSALMGNVAAATLDDVRPKQVVSFADLNISRLEGIAQLYRRIQNAGRQVCAPYSERDLGQVARSHVCLEQAISGAVSSLNIQALTSYHLAKTGRSNAPARVARQP
jgi:UrcA family protein